MRPETIFKIAGSGKSSIGIALAVFISKLTGIPFTLKNICPNEIIYLQRLKDPKLPNGSVFLIDEQSLSIEERVRTDRGIIPLQNLKIGEKINVLSLNVKTLKEEYKLAVKVKNKIKPTFQIITENGKSVEATEDHVFFVEENGRIVEKRLRELKKGEKLVCF